MRKFFILMAIVATLTLGMSVTLAAPTAAPAPANQTTVVDKTETPTTGTTEDTTTVSNMRVPISMDCMSYAHQVRDQVEQNCNNSCMDPAGCSLQCWTDGHVAGIGAYANCSIGGWMAIF